MVRNIGLHFFTKIYTTRNVTKTNNNRDTYYYERIYVNPSIVYGSILIDR